MPNNVLDAIDALLAEHGVDSDVTLLVPTARPHAADVLLVGRRPGWEDSPGVREALAALEAGGEVAVSGREPERNQLHLRLSAEWLAALGTALEAGEADALPTADVAAGKRYVVDFCDPNASKALHVGHLRHIALGNALAGLATHCGARGERTTQIGDYGRSMGEAMAGWLLFADGATPASLGRKGDHFVGELYAQYVRASNAEEPPEEVVGADPALSREDRARDDLAEQLLQRWLAGEPEATELWRTMRDWALDGQNATLARLGVHFDRYIYESELTREIVEFSERAVARGIAERTPEGAVVFRTGTEEYPILLLNRTDGFPTQHQRYFVMWHHSIPELEGAISYALMGDEWVPLSVHGQEIFRRYETEREIHPTVCVVHGMVTMEGGALSSSQGSVWLIDQLLDELAADQELVALASRHERADADRLAVITALGLCLSRRKRKTMAFSRDLLFHTDANPGWAMAQAWVKAWDPAFDGAPDPAPDETDYRFLLVQSQLHRRFAARSIEAIDPFDLIRFHGHLAQWFLAADDSPRLARAMRAILERGLDALALDPGRSAIDSARAASRAARA
jgi:arginyl-tRNA synthetase